MPAADGFDRKCAEARQLLEGGDVEAAATALEQALAIYADDAEVHEELGGAYFYLERYDAAIQHFQQASRLAPRRATPFINLGAVYNRLGEYTKAIDSLRKAVQTDPKSSDAYYNMALTHRKLKQWPLAVSAYREAIRINPSFLEAHQNLGNVFMEMSNFPQAVQQFQRALELSPGFPKAQAGLERAKQALAEQRDARGPFGRLVDASQLEHTQAQLGTGLKEHQDDMARYQDRKTLLQLSGDLDGQLQEMLFVLREDLEPQLLALSKTLAHSTSRTAVLEAVQHFREARQSFRESCKRLSRTTERMRAHEEHVSG